MTAPGTAVEAAWLLEQAWRLLHHGYEPTAGLWPRAAALLGRQALDELCEAQHQGLGHCGSTRAQLLCLWGERR